MLFVADAFFVRGFLRLICISARNVTRDLIRFNPVMRTWNRTGSSAREFEIDMSKQAVAFPLPEKKQKGAPVFTQCIRDGKVVAESVSYWTRETKEQIDQRMTKAIQDLAVETNREDKELPAEKVTTFTFTIRGRAGEIKVVRETNGAAHVAFEFPKDPGLDFRERDESAAVR